MRQLFVPACVCFMTWSGATGSDPRLSLDEFFGPAKASSKVHAQHAPVDNAVPASIEAGSAEPVRAEIPVDLSAAEIALEAPAAETPNAPAQFTEQRIPLPPIAKPVVHRSREEVCDTLTQAAQTNDLPVPFFIRLLFQESRFQPGVVSSAGAQGVAQFMPETAASRAWKIPSIRSRRFPLPPACCANRMRSSAISVSPPPPTMPGPGAFRIGCKEGQAAGRNQGLRQKHHRPPAENWTAASAEHPGQRLPRHAPCQESAGNLCRHTPETIATWSPRVPSILTNCCRTPRYVCPFGLFRSVMTKTESP